MEMRDRNHYARRPYSTNHDERPEDNSLNRSHCFESKTPQNPLLRNMPDPSHPLAFPLASHDGGQSFQTVQNILTEDLGYHISRRTTDTQPYVAQRRRRVLITSHQEPDRGTGKRPSNRRSPLQVKRDCPLDTRWPSGYCCRACPGNTLRVDPDNRPGLSEELGRDVKQRLKLGDALRGARLL